jgi:hypothetical protein
VSAGESSSRAREIAGEVDSRQAAVGCLPKTTHRFHPAEDFCDPPAHLLTGGIPRYMGRPSVDGAAAARCVLRHMRRDALCSQGLHTLARVIALSATSVRGWKPPAGASTIRCGTTSRSALLGLARRGSFSQSAARNSGVVRGRSAPEPPVARYRQGGIGLLAANARSRFGCVP